jgi:hypothetical protein
MLALTPDVAALLKQPLTLLGIAIISFAVFGRTLWKWRPRIWITLVVVGALLLGSVFFFARSVGFKTTSVPVTLGPPTITVQGTLKLTNGKAYIVPAANQEIRDETLMVMSELPPGGTVDERRDAAFSYFSNYSTKDMIQVTGTLFPYGQMQAISVKSTQ